MIQEMIYGPNTEAVQAIIDRIPTLTEDEVNRLEAAWDAAWAASRHASWDAARSADWAADWAAAWAAAWDASRYAYWDAARSAAWDAIIATVTYDLATETGPYTIVQRDLLLAPWIEVCG